MDFTEKLIEIMEKSGVSRSQLSEKLQVNRAAVSRLLNNGSNITLKRALSLAEALNCHFEFKFVENEKYQVDSDSCGIRGKKLIHESVEYFNPENLKQWDVNKSLVYPSDDYVTSNWDENKGLNAA